MRHLKTQFFLFSFALLIIFSSCNRNNSNVAVKLNIPIWLNYDITEIYLSDFENPEKIDSVVVDCKRISLQAKQQIFWFKTPKNAPPLMVMTIWSGSNQNSVLLKKSLKQKVTFVFDPKDKTHKTVQLAGEFNGWTANKSNLKLIGKKWYIDILLNKGKYQYQLVVDGKNILDPANHDSIDNNLGGFNSVLTIGNINYDKLPSLVTYKFDDDQIQIKTKNKPDNIFVFWNNILLNKSEYKTDNNLLSINIPKESKRHKRSYFMIYAYNSEGTSNDVLIPLEKNKVVSKPEQLSRTDPQSNILYNVFIDRFFDGDSTNNHPIKDSLILPKVNYFGGDISGVLAQLNAGYFDSLGVNTLWISPLVKNPDEAYGQWKKPPTKFSGYHGYWPISFTRMDERFGTEAEFKNLVEKLHSKDKNILLDFVAHHIHENHPYYKSHPDCATPLKLPDGTLNLEKWDEYRLTTWFDVFLPTLNLGNEETSNMVSDSAVWWLQNYKIDGFRHDAAKHVPLSFWRTLTHKIAANIEVPEKRKIFQLGETYGGLELINSYIGSGLLDAQFDFNVYDAAISSFAADKPFYQLQNRLLESSLYYGSHNLMGYISGNQDRGRFISYAGGDLKFEENAKEAGWSRNIGVGNPIGYQKLSMLMAFNMTIPGLPVIYYGDEFGMPGANDPDCRRMMRFGNQLNQNEKLNLEITKKIISIRRNNLALLYGDFCYFKTDKSTMVFARKYFSNIVIAVFNNSKIDQTIKINLSDFSEDSNFIPNFGSKSEIKNNVLSLVVKGSSFEIYTIKQ